MHAGSLQLMRLARCQVCRTTSGRRAMSPPIRSGSGRDPAGMRSIPLPSLLRFLAGAESLGADAGPAAVNRPLGFARSYDRRPGFDESPLGNPGPVDVHRNLSADTRQTFSFSVAAIQ